MAVMRDVKSLVPNDVLEGANRFVSKLAENGSPKRSMRFSPDDLASEPALFKWGLSDELLDLAENYIGLPVHYRGVDIKREVADGCGRDVRQWHIDVDDRRMLKVIVYLNNVDELGGPFEYIDPDNSSHAVDVLHYTSGFVTDEVMSSVVPPQNWQCQTGPRLSAIFVDTSRVFHRVRPPIETDRYSMTFSYSSETPIQVFPEFSLKRSTLRQLRPGLTSRQWRASKLV